MEKLQKLTQEEHLKIEGGILDGPISDWVACKVNSFIEKIKKNGAGNYSFESCGRGNNVRC